MSTRTCVASVPSAKDPVYITCQPPAQYQALHYHRPQSTVADKSRWCISRDDECHAFCVSADRGWADSSGDHWYIAPDGQELGTRHERVATFLKPRNAADPWHGFPVAGSRDAIAKRPVPREVLQSWTDERVAKRDFLAKLWRRAA